MSETQLAAPVEHVWLSDEFSVPRATMCMHRPPSPNADHGCIRPVGHTDAHVYIMLTEPGTIRSYSAQEARAAAEGKAPLNVKSPTSAGEEP